MSQSLRVHLLLCCVAALWGSTFVLVKDALADISPLLFNLIRMAIAFLCLAIVYRRQMEAHHPCRVEERSFARPYPGDCLSVPDSGVESHGTVQVRLHYRADSRTGTFVRGASWSAAFRGEGSILECLAWGGSGLRRSGSASGAGGGRKQGRQLSAS